MGDIGIRHTHDKALRIVRGIWMLLAACCILYATNVIATDAGSPQNSRMVLGCGGHPKSHGLWSDPTTQFNILKERGLKTYRVDVPLLNDNPGVVGYFQKLVELARRYEIELHPILYVPFSLGDATDGGKYPNSEAGLEAQGYDRVYPFVSRFSRKVRYWELDNELTLRAGIKKGVGRNPQDFDTPVGRQWAAVLRGMQRAIRDVRERTGEPLKIVVDIVYVDFGFIPFLQAQGVDIDRVAYHYYYHRTTSPYKLSAPDGATVNLFGELRKLNRPVIINEFNAAEIYAPRKGKPYNASEALASLKTHIEYILNQREADIEGIEFYELFDEPDKDTVESNFGLMKDASHPKTQMLLAATYACGKLSKAEQLVLVEAGLFSVEELATKMSNCQSATSNPKQHEPSNRVGRGGRTDYRK